MRIFVADLSMTGMSHVYFNGAFLRILKDTFEEDIIFWGEENHINYLVKNGDIDANYVIKFSSKTRRGINILIQDIENACRMVKIFKKTVSQDIIVLLNRLPITLLICMIANIFLKRKIINILHGELEYLVNPNIKGGSKFLYKLFLLPYCLSTSNAIYVFLGESIKHQILRKNINFGNAKLISVNHPYEYNIFPINVSDIKLMPKSIGIIGTANKRKNSHYLKQLEGLLTDKSILTVTGRIEEELKKDFEVIGILSGDKIKDNDEYVKDCLSLVYSLCFYDATVNIALASGSFFDSIKFAKPILGLKGNPFVDYYFEKLGNIGYLFESIEQMADYINGLSINSIPVDYQLQVSNLIKAQEILSIHNIGKEFRKQIIPNLIV